MEPFISVPGLAPSYATWRPQHLLASYLSCSRPKITSFAHLLQGSAAPWRDSSCFRAFTMLRPLARRSSLLTRSIALPLGSQLRGGLARPLLAPQTRSLRVSSLIRPWELLSQHGSKEPRAQEPQEQPVEGHQQQQPQVGATAWPRAGPHQAARLPVLRAHSASTAARCRSNCRRRRRLSWHRTCKRSTRTSGTMASSGEFSEGLLGAHSPPPPRPTLQSSLLHVITASQDWLPATQRST